MDAIEFAKTVREICKTHGACCDCEFDKVPGKCNITASNANHEVMVSVADRWAKERRREVTLTELIEVKSKRDKLEARFTAAIESSVYGPKNYTKMIQDDLNGAIYRSLILNRERIENLDDNLVTLQHNMAGLEAKIAALANAMDEMKGAKN